MTKDDDDRLQTKMGRPRKVDNEILTTVSCRLSPRQIAVLDRFGAIRNIPRSVALRRAVDLLEEAIKGD